MRSLWARHLFVGAVVGAVFAAGASAGAVTITGAQIATACDGVSSCAPAAGVSISSSPGAMTANELVGVRGVGIAGLTAGEIDAGEFLTIEFSAPVLLNSFRLGAFFNGSEFNDQNERGFVRVLYSDNSAQLFQLDVTGENTATIDGGFGAVVTNCGATTDSGAGCFDFGGNPLSNKLISRLVFTAADKPSTGPTGSNNSDYFFAGFSYSIPEVPIPGAVPLMATGLVAFAAWRRKARAR